MSAGFVNRRRGVPPAAVVLALGSLALSGCAGPSGPTPSVSATQTVETLCAAVGVALCDQGTDRLTVTVSAEATDAAVLDIAQQLAELAEAEEMSGDAVLQRETAADAPVLDAEVAPPVPWMVTVYPDAPADLATTLGGMLAVEDVAGVVGIDVAGGWPTVIIGDLALFDDAFAAASALPLLAGGATYTLHSLDERLRIVHVPERTSNEAIHEIVDIARSHPAAEVLWEAPTAGPQFPTLYVARLTPDEVVALDLRLRDPRLASADVDGLAMEYVLSSLGTEGVSYTSGTLGAVPSS